MRLRAANSSGLPTRNSWGWGGAWGWGGGKGTNEDVLGLHVAVDDAVAVEVMERPDELLCDPLNLTLRQRMVVLRGRRGGGGTRRLVWEREEREERRGEGGCGAPSLRARGGGARGPGNPSPFTPSIAIGLRQRVVVLGGWARGNETKASTPNGPTLNNKP